MDIIELSNKLKGDLLESHSNHITLEKPLPKHIFSPRITRSQSTSFRMSNSIREEENFDLHKRNQNKSNNLEKIYLNKNVRVVHKNLETIYEYPLWKKGNAVLLGAGKVKRSLYLDREFRITSKQKSKLRKMKIKRLGKKFNSLKLTDDEFKRKMLTVENYLNDVDMPFNIEGFADKIHNKPQDYDVGASALHVCQKNETENKDMMPSEDDY